MLQTGSGHHNSIPKKSQEPKSRFDRAEATPTPLPRLLLWPQGFQAFVDRPSPPPLPPSLVGREHVPSPPAPDYLTDYLTDPVTESVPASTKPATWNSTHVPPQGKHLTVTCSYLQETPPCGSMHMATVRTYVSFQRLFVLERWCMCKNRRSVEGDLPEPYVRKVLFSGPW